nr:hypothetical protein [Tanacetum cinerariifolium]
MGRDTVQLETAVNTISQEYLLEFTSEYGIPETLRPELPGPEDRIVDFSEGKVSVYTKFFEFANFRLPLSQFLFDVLDGMPAENTYSVEAVRALDTHRTPIQKQPEMLLCLVGISRRYYGGRDMDLFNLTRAPNPTKVKIESRPPTNSSGVPSTIERSPLDFAHEAERCQLSMLPGPARLKKLLRRILLRPQSAVKEA